MYRAKCEDKSPQGIGEKELDSLFGDSWGEVQVSM